MRCWDRIMLALVAISLVGTVGRASTIRHDRTDDQYTQFANGNFPNVGAMLFDASGASYLCSGTLIHPEWVLTAAHCVDGASNIRFRTGENFRTNYQEMASATGVGIPHPDWNGDLAKGHDIGLFKLLNPINTIQPATLFTGSDERGNVAYSVGYGQTGRGDDTVRSTDGKKRVNENDIDIHWSTRGKVNSYFGLDFDHPTNSSVNSFGGSDANELEGSTLFGDSGGGVFIQVNSQYQLAGVNSFISATDGTADGSYGDRSGHTRVAVYADWINQTISGTSGGGGSGGGSSGGGGRGKKNVELELSLLDEDVVVLTQPLAFSAGSAVSVPEPSSLALTGWLAFIGAALTRRKLSAGVRCRAAHV